VEPPENYGVIVVVIIVALLVCFLFLVWYGQERILFQPPRHWIDIETDGKVEYKASAGQQLAGYIVGDPRNGAGVLLCFHGNADLTVWQTDWAAAVAAVTGYTVFLAEYRGYLSLDGTPTYASTKLDSNAAYNYVVSTLGIDPARIAFFGHSLGSGVATELAEVHSPSVLILQSPFTSARAMARLMVSPPVEAFWNRVSRIHFGTQRAVASLPVPVSVAHGKRDRIVPFRMGLQVYESARKKGELLIVEKAGHNDLPSVGGDDYWKWITASLRGPRANTSM
jgi:fermentation-respiration switch protein FrsA (DUF1100 family)